VIDDAIASRVRPSLRRSLTVVAVWGAVWLVPLALVVLLVGGASVFAQIGVFFSTAAVVTFGGAYAVLAYVAQQAVDTYGWLRPGEMLDGLGMAETTPGPLIQVVQFVAFMGASRFSEGMHPVTAGVLGSILATWVTFAPCFLWIFLGAPYIEYLRGNRRLTSALSGITAAVVGVVLNLAVWFALHVIFAHVEEVRAYGMRLHVPEVSTLDVGALLLTAGAFVALFRFRFGMIPTLASGAAAGFVYFMLVRA
jgi:chromate transporter